MTFIDPVVISNAALTGSMDFGGWPIVWLTLIGLLVGSAAAIAFASASVREPRPRLRPRPEPRLPQVGAMGALSGRTR